MVRRGCPDLRDGAGLARGGGQAPRQAAASTPLTNFVTYYKFEMTVSAEIVRGGGCGVEGLIDAAFI